jgi:hypothetical protein
MATSPARTRVTWLNHLVGYACGSILLHEYKAFRYPGLSRPSTNFSDTVVPLAQFVEGMTKRREGSRT